jgi:endonuclease-3 related protein
MDKTRLWLSYYKKMLSHFGYQNWWPAEDPFEVMVGAILTQNTNWVNVEKAIANLKTFDLLSPEKLYRIEPSELARLIRPAGYFNIKAKRLKEFIRWFVERFDGKIERLKSLNPLQLREELLGIRGIGKETADSIMLYGLQIPTFVVDLYTHRIFSRHGLLPEEADYDQIKEFFEESLPKDLRLYNDYHAQIVKTAKTYCKRKPLCKGCPLRIFLSD